MLAPAALGAAPTAGVDAPLAARRAPELAVRLGWLAAAAVATTLIAAGLPGYVERLATVCADAACGRGGRSPATLPSLAAVGLTLPAYARLIALINIGVAAVFAATGALLVWRRPQQRMARFSAFALLFFAGPINFASFVAHLHPAVRALGAAFDVAGASAFAALVFVFPDGRFVPRWTRWVAFTWIALQAATPFFPSGSGAVRTALDVLSTPVWAGGLLAAAFAQVHRYRRVSTAAQRQQTKWTAFGFAIALALYASIGLALVVNPALREPVPMLVLGTVAYLGMTPVPVSVAVALLRHGLFDVDVVIGRTIVYAALTATIVAVYVLVVGYLGSLFRTDENIAISLAATGVVAVLFQPLRERLQRGVNRVLYGQRDEPYAALATLGRQLDATGDPTAMLPAAAETIARALNLPYVAIAIRRAQGEEPSLGTEIVAAAGSPSPWDEPAIVPLLHRGAHVGGLVLGHRGRGEPFSSTDRLLLDDLARQAAAAVHAVRLTAELQQARARLVGAREEERRRLRRDLHDGLGPTLAALGLKLDTARNLLEHDPRASALLTDLAERTQAAVADIRRLVYGLRPPALDDRGLVGAIRQVIAGFETQAPGVGLHVTVDAPSATPPLPAAVEVAAFRIAQEALTNIVRHARATSCEVHLEVDAQALRLTVEDDGVGLAEGHTPGVGLASMRERAEELGGSLHVTSRLTGGMRVEAFLPFNLDAGPPASAVTAGAHA